MRIEIDQSNKVEQTNKSTVVAFSNGHHRSIMTSAREKQLAIFIKHHVAIDPRIIQFREIGKKSRAHSVAYQAAKSGKANQKVMAKEVLRVLMT